MYLMKDVISSSFCKTVKQSETISRYMNNLPLNTTLYDEVAPPGMWRPVLRLTEVAPNSALSWPKIKNSQLHLLLLHAVVMQDGLPGRCTFKGQAMLLKNKV